MIWVSSIMYIALIVIGISILFQKPKNVKGV